MDTAGLRLQRSVERGAEEVRLQLDGREAGRAFGQRRDAAVAARGIRERDDGPRVEIAVGREQLGAQRQAHAHVAFLDLDDLHAEQARQPVPAGVDERLDIDGHYLPALAATYFATALICASVSVPLKAGIAPPPWMTWFCATGNDGFS